MVTPSSKFLSWNVLYVHCVHPRSIFFCRLCLEFYGCFLCSQAFNTSKYKMWCPGMGKLKRVAMAWLQPVKKKKKKKILW